MKQFLSLGLLLAITGCNTNTRGTRCNPLRATSDCDPRFSCIYPITPSCNPSQPGSNCCGVSYCCAVDSMGNVVDRDPNCQPDPDSAMACGLDLGAAQMDGM